MRRIRRLGALACAATLCGSLATCGFPAQDDATSLADEDLPAGLRADVVPSSNAPVETELATIWLIEDEELVSAQHDVASPASVDSVVDALLAGPSDSEQERGLRSALPDPTVIVDVESSRGRALVELAPAFADISAADQVLAVGQVVLTMTGLPGVGGVQFTLDGSPVAVPVPTGESSPGPILREQFLELTRPH